MLCVMSLKFNLEIDLIYFEENSLKIKIHNLNNNYPHTNSTVFFIS